MLDIDVTDLGVEIDILEQAITLPRHLDPIFQEGLPNIAGFLISDRINLLFDLFEILGFRFLLANPDAPAFRLVSLG